MRGAMAAAEFLVSLGRRARADQVTMTLVDVNGQPGAIAHDPAGNTIAVLSLDIVDGQVNAVRSVVNPDKLGHLSSPPVL